MENIIQLNNVKKIYRMGDEKIYALKNVDLSIKQGEFICLLGTSGSGKSTLLNLMAGLEKPTKGEIIIKNKSIEKMNEKQLAKFRQENIGFVFQSYNLLPMLTAIENVSLPLIFRGVSKKNRIKAAAKMLQSVGLGDRLNHKPSEMSGGQQQRVSIARAFISKPSIVFADEPTGNLDTKTTLDIMELITNFARQSNQTLIIVTHDIEISHYADKVVYIKDGEIERIEEQNQRGII
ncbi:ABC transporter ATP-binding protein [Serpentinicella alkaliphila]|uniref:Putative ABC transport system ATP-binding protein n=1 Tax=Serpentinicella alkaliphila TaxID=1734049 RepID=A0A4R2U317_9FIRM|nr:ABC transporter ATP-binding protein [Serpentinicella alkaliphila]QUH25948.1 ABC transporter ATP-binding protein [Serpentinicella alkaliphila]TCQ02053.1 putative ABC transport system ATP-binding protein [Serpentinicella alkaliphila]